MSFIQSMKFNDNIKPDKSNFLLAFLKTLKDRIVLYDERKR